LQEHGAELGIPYRVCVDEYTGYLQTGLGQIKPSVKALLQHWNSTLFPGQTHVVQMPKDVLAARAALAEESPDEDEAEGNEGGQGEGAGTGTDCDERQEGEEEP
jgi:hypothetical protein